MYESRQHWFSTEARETGLPSEWNHSEHWRVSLSAATDGGFHSLALWMTHGLVLSFLALPLLWAFQNESQPFNIADHSLAISFYYIYKYVYTYYSSFEPWESPTATLQLVRRQKPWLYLDELTEKPKRLKGREWKLSHDVCVAIVVCIELGHMKRGLWNIIDYCIIKRKLLQEN